MQNSARGLGLFSANSKSSTATTSSKQSYIVANFSNDDHVIARKFAVVDAVPYYCSIDKSFEFSHVWFPASLVDKKRANFFNVHDPLTDDLAERLPTKEIMITSARLSGEHFPWDSLVSVDLTHEEQIRLRRFIVFNEKPLFETSNPTEVKQWLMGQGAMITGELLPAAIEPQKHIETKNDSRQFKF